MNNAILSPPIPPLPEHLIIGSRGEKIACRFLQSLGYRILGRNVHLAKDEIDILAWDPVDAVVVFAEVKTRSRTHCDYTPELNLTHQKRTNMIRGARQWVARCAWEGGYRMDLLGVMDGKVVEHLKELSWGETRGRFR